MKRFRMFVGGRGSNFGRVGLSRWRWCWFGFDVDILEAAKGVCGVWRVRAPRLQRLS